MDETEYLNRLKDLMERFDPENPVLVMGEGKTTAGEIIDRIDERLENPFGEFEDEDGET